MTEPISAFVNLLFPPLCRGCGEVLPDHRDGVVCESCQAKVQVIIPPVCERCGAPIGKDEMTAAGSAGCLKCAGLSWAIERTRSAVAYETPIRELIHEFKFRGSWKVRPILIDFFLEGAGRFFRSPGFDVVLPVPLHWWRHFSREFNQAEVLAQAIAARWGLPVLKQALRRVRPTPPQSRLPGKWRNQNLEGAFAGGKQAVEGFRVLLVDDVMTTGATLSACAEVLKERGATSVEGYTLARRL